MKAKSTRDPERAALRRFVQMQLQAHGASYPAVRFRTGLEKLRGRLADLPAPWPNAVAEMERLCEELEVERVTLEAERLELSQAQQKLEVSRDRYVNLFDSAPIGFVTLGRHGAINDINLKGAHLLGLQRARLRGRPLLMFVSLKDRRKFLNYLRRAFHSAGEIWAEFHFGCTDGHQKLLEFTTGLTPALAEGFPAIQVAFRDVTEQRLAEQAVRAAEMQLSLMSDIAPVMLARCSATQRYLFVNRAYAEFLGLSREQIIGRPIAEIMGKAASKTVQPYINLVLQGRPVQFEMTVPYPQKTEPRFMRVAYRPELDAERKVAGWVAAINDITDRKQAEAKLQEAHDRLEERVRERTAELQRLNSTLELEIQAHKKAETLRSQLAAIVESSADAILSVDHQLNIVSFNKGAENLYGYAAGEIVGRPIALLIPSDRFPEFRQSFRRLWRGQRLEPFDTIRRRKDGALFEVSLTLSPIKDAEGRTAGVSDVTRDISDRKRAEQATRESEARLRAIMDNSPAIVFLKDLDGRYLHVNRQFSDVFHLSAEKVIGRTDEALFPPKQAAEFRANDRKMFEAGHPMVFHEIARHRDGQHTSIVVKFPLFDLNGRIYALGGIVTDVTERRRLEEEIVRISEHEQERIAQDLHDGLGQQIAGTWFLCDTLRKTLAAKGSPEEPTASKIVRLLETTVSQIRSLARGLSPVPAQPDGLMAALEGLATQCSELFGVNCRFDCPRPVLVTKNKIATNLYRIAQEAINNAVKHGRAREIEIRLFATEGRPTLRVLDDGIGLKKLPNAPKGMGLRTMNYRADAIGADFAIRKRKRRGTEVTCNLRDPE